MHSEYFFFNGVGSAKGLISGRVSFTNEFTSFQLIHISVSGLTSFFATAFKA
jgi:hypothetical protein